MNKSSMCSLISTLLGALLAASAHAGPGPLGLDVSVGLAGVLPDIKSPAVNAALGGRLDANNMYVPVANFTYYLTEHFALGTSAGITRHKFDASNFGAVGKASMAPFHLMAQYHFLPNADFRPYVGVGIHHTIFFKQTGPVFSQLKDFPSDTGHVLQAGFSYSVNKDYFVNFDVKKFYLETDVKFKGAPSKLETIKLDPWLVGLAIGKQF